MNSRAMKIASLLLLVLLLAGFAAAATPAQAAGAPKPKAVVLDQRGTITIPLGTPLTLNATLLPAGAQITVLLRNGGLVLFYDGLSLSAGEELTLLRRREEGRICDPRCSLL